MKEFCDNWDREGKKSFVQNSHNLYTIFPAFVDDECIPKFCILSKTFLQVSKT